MKSSEQDGKKIYTITDEGRDFLKEREETIDKIKGHMKNWWGHSHREEFRDIFHELVDLGRLIGKKADQMDPDKWAKIKEIIAKACHDIEEIVNQ